MRDASAIKVIESLLGKGVAKIHAYDPLAVDEAKKEFDPKKNILFEKIEYFNTAKDAIKKSDSLFISSDCEEFRGLSRTVEETVSPPYLVIDGRRMIPDFDEIVERGYSYLAVGSMCLSPRT
jgi:UDPglucose 6-dehydrogenase